MGIREWILGGDVKPSCETAREDLKYCILESDCVRKDGYTPNQCLKNLDGAQCPYECTQLRVAFFECKRSILDMRTRFRGRKGDVYLQEAQKNNDDIEEMEILK